MEEFAEDIWLLDGDCVSVLGFDYPTRAAVIRLADGDLLIWSPVKLTQQMIEAVGRIGPVRYLIAPNTIHHLHVADWLSAFPDAALFGPRALQTKRPDLRFAGFLDDAGGFVWSAELAQQIVPHKITTEVVFFHHRSRTVLFTDLIQQFPRGWHRGWRSVIARLDLMVGDAPNVPRKFRLGFGSRRQARAVMKPILDWPAERVIMAHGQPVTQNGQAVLRKSFDWLF